MSDRKRRVSQDRLREIGQQMGVDILTPTAAIRDEDGDGTVAAELLDPLPSGVDYDDLSGVVDAQPRSKSPLVQYAVSGGIALAAVGVPVALILGSGGSPTTKSPDIKDKNIQNVPTTAKDDQLEQLKTQLALDIQSKAANAAPSPASSPATPSPNVVSSPAPTAASPQPTPAVTVASSPVTPIPAVEPVKPAPQKPQRTVKATERPVTTVQIPKREYNSIALSQPPVVRPMVPPSKVIKPRLPNTAIAGRTNAMANRMKVAPAPEQPGAVTPKTSTAPVSVVPPEATTSGPTNPHLVSWEQAAAMSAYGGLPQAKMGKSDENAALASKLAVRSDLSPALLLPIGANVEARTITPFHTVVGRRSTTQSEDLVSIQFDRAIELGQGYHLPIGTIVQFRFVVADNGVVTATSQGVYINGVEIQVPPGVLALTADNSQALIADRRSVRTEELAGADTSAAFWGAAGSVGKVLAEAGNQTVINNTGLGSSVIKSNSNNPNIAGALLDGAFSPLAESQRARANKLADEVQGLSKLFSVPVGTKVRVFVAAPGIVQIPVGSSQGGETTEISTAGENPLPIIEEPRVPQPPETTTSELP